MQESDYALKLNHVTWDANPLNQFIEESSDKWELTDQVMPCIKLTGFEPPIKNILKQLFEDFRVSLNESYIVKLKANSVLTKHSDSPRRASFNFPLTDNISSTFVKFYKIETLPPQPAEESVYQYDLSPTPFILNVGLEHSFHNPTDSDVILLNLSTFDDWDTVRQIIESKAT